MEAKIILCGSSTAGDKRLAEGLRKRARLFKQQGVDIWDTTDINPGLHIIGETIQAILASSIIILFISIDFLLDPLIEQITPLIIAREMDGKIQIIPVLLSPCSYSSSAFAHDTLINNRSMAEMKPADREKVWEHTCTKIFNALSIQQSPPHINSLITDQYLRDLHITFTKHTNLQVKSFSGTGNGVFNHGLTVNPDQILLATNRIGDNIPDQIINYTQAGSTVSVSSSCGLAFTGLVIAKVTNTID